MSGRSERPRLDKAGVSPLLGLDGSHAQRFRSNGNARTDRYAGGGRGTHANVVFGHLVAGSWSRHRTSRRCSRCYVSANGWLGRNANQLTIAGEGSVLVGLCKYGLLRFAVARSARGNPKKGAVRPCLGTNVTRRLPARLGGLALEDLVQPSNLVRHSLSCEFCWTACHRSSFDFASGFASKRLHRSARLRRSSRTFGRRNSLYSVRLSSERRTFVSGRFARHCASGPCCNWHLRCAAHRVLVTGSKVPLKWAARIVMTGVKGRLTLPLPETLSNDAGPRRLAVWSRLPKKSRVRTGQTVQHNRIATMPQPGQME